MSERCAATIPLEEIPCPVHGTLAACPVALAPTLASVVRLLTAPRTIRLVACHEDR